MGILGFRRKDEKKMTFVESVPYSSDNTEENLHRIIATNPRLVVIEGEDGKRLPTAAIASHIRLPGGEELDLLLMDIKGSLTLVELKRDKTPRDVVAQILDYASSVYQLTLEDLEKIIQERSKYKGGIDEVLRRLREDNPEFEDVDYGDIKENLEESLSGRDLQLLIVSYEIDDSIRRVAEFLRSVYGVKIYCVEFAYFSGEEYEYFIPETIGIEEVKKIERKELTTTQKSYLAFYSELLGRLRKRMPNITHQKAYPQNWLEIPIGHTYIHLEWAFHGRPRDSFEVGLHFEKPSAEENKALLEAFQKDEVKLKSEMGDLYFQYPWGKRWARIYTLKNEGEMTEELKDWAVNTLIKFYKTFKPRLDKQLRSI